MPEFIIKRMELVDNLDGTMTQKILTVVDGKESEETIIIEGSLNELMLGVINVAGDQVEELSHGLNATSVPSGVDEVD